MPVAFLARHGTDHTLSPSEVPGRANIAALRKLGVRSIVAFSAVGSLKEEVKPEDFVVVDGGVDWTRGKREPSFFGEGVVGTFFNPVTFCLPSTNDPHRSHTHGRPL